MAPKKSKSAACSLTAQPLYGGKKCVPCEGGTPALSVTDIERGLSQLAGWAYTHGAIRKTYRFKNYHETMAFVNATAWISHRENHHPDLSVYYDRCEVAYHTHAINGISENDFICAVKIEQLFAL